MRKKGQCPSFFLRPRRSSSITRTMDLNNTSINASLNASVSRSDIKDVNISLLPCSYVFWILVDTILFIVIISGNVLTVLAITMCRRLRSLTSNYFVLSLALSDLLVGLTLPYHLAFYVHSSLSEIKLVCILRFVIISLACGGSIYNLIIIAIDRYIAIIHPLKYDVHMTKRHVLLMIFIGWVYTIGVATIPMYWNCFDTATTCELDTVLPRYYTVAILMPSFFLVWLSMFLLYWQIWREASTHIRRLKHSGFHSIQQNDWKSVQVVLLVLGCFSICWFPYLIVACTRAFDWNKKSTPTLYRATFSLAMANSGMNPIIYAWKNANFRKAFHKLLHFQSPNQDYNSSLKAYVEKQNELKRTNAELEDNRTHSTIHLHTVKGSVTNEEHGS